MNSSNLTVGSYGDEVKTLHSKLKEYGFEIPPSEKDRGFFGPGTREAVRRWQEKNGLKVTGVLDDKIGIPTGTVEKGLKETIHQGLTGAATLSTAPAPSASRDAASGAPKSDEGQFVVRGHVVYRDGLLIEGMTVRAYNKDLRR